MVTFGASKLGFGSAPAYGDDRHQPLVADSFPAIGGDMTTSTSSWIAHASREPGAAMITGMSEWVAESVQLAAENTRGCAFIADEAHAVIVAHTDRAMHKRRHRPTFMVPGACSLPAHAGHGLRPMSTLIADDEYGPEALLIEHTGSASPLAEAIGRATSADRSALIPVMSEAEFLNSEHFQSHQSRPLEVRDAGAVLPFVLVAAEPLADAEERESLVRAAGWASYTFECDWNSFTYDDHTRLALLLEDVLDEIVQIKADIEARMLTAPPLWPLVEMRSL